jgi:hypothetical protein
MPMARRRNRTSGIARLGLSLMGALGLSLLVVLVAVFIVQKLFFGVRTDAARMRVTQERLGELVEAFDQLPDPSGTSGEPAWRERDCRTDSGSPLQPYAQRVWRTGHADLRAVRKAITADLVMDGWEEQQRSASGQTILTQGRDGWVAEAIVSEIVDVDTRGVVVNATVVSAKPCES